MFTCMYQIIKTEGAASESTNKFIAEWKNSEAAICWLSQHTELLLVECLHTPHSLNTTYYGYYW